MLIVEAVGIEPTSFKPSDLAIRPCPFNVWATGANRSCPIHHSVFPESQSSRSFPGVNLLLLPGSVAPPPWSGREMTFQSPDKSDESALKGVEFRPKGVTLKVCRVICGVYVW